jgi:hypothetical protein
MVSERALVVEPTKTANHAATSIPATLSELARTIDVSSDAEFWLPFLFVESVRRDCA